eukprot:TRINITY_DN35064_c0_g1_i1.p1 TRINITY_DN35064_c0_g1~~TRINITY_DN35064_c0_g1_i1.p1  ORF type:complete len:385 (+),score=48.13 TRINITY_DN35064_c0_g1_i1:42-1196(+)
MSAVSRKRAWVKGWRKRSIKRDVNKAKGSVLRMLQGGEAARSKDLLSDLTTLLQGEDTNVKEEFSKKIWNIEPLTTMEENYVQRRTKGAIKTHAIAGSRVITCVTPLTKGEIVFKESTPLFGPNIRHCTACDAPTTSVSCGKCGSWFCSAACRDASSFVHKLECRMLTSAAFKSLSVSYQRGAYGLHSSLHVPVQGRFLHRNTNVKLFRKMMLLIARCISIAQHSPDRFTDPTNLPMVSMLPYVPIPTAVDVMPLPNLNPPIELGMLFHLMRTTADILGTGPASVNALWSTHRAALWGLWEALLHNHQNGSLFPVASLIPHSANPTVSRYFPSASLCYVVAETDLPPGSQITTSYVPLGTPEALRAQLLRKGWGIYEDVGAGHL